MKPNKCLKSHDIFMLIQTFNLKPDLKTLFENEKFPALLDLFSQTLII